MEKPWEFRPGWLFRTAYGPGDWFPPVCLVVSCAVLLSTFGQQAAAQTMVTTTVPFQSQSESFFQSSNVHWSVNGPGFFATFGSPGIGPRFGGYVPGAGIQSGWSVCHGGFTTNFGFEFSQGFRRTSTTTAVTVTSLDGYPASFFAGQTRPFVYSLVPVIPNGGGQFSLPPGYWIRQQQLNDLNLPEAEDLETAAAHAQARGRQPEHPAAAIGPGDREADDPENRRGAGAFRYFQGVKEGTPDSETQQRRASAARYFRQQRP